MFKLANRLKETRDYEEGSDIVTTLFMIPFILGLIFVMVDVSSYFQARSAVQSIVRDGARQVALYGGQAANIPLNEADKSVANQVRSRLWQNGQCVVSACTSAPVVVCGPNRATSLNADAFCRVTYSYRGFGGGLVQWLGFGAVIDPPFEIEERFKVETKY